MDKFSKVLREHIYRNNIKIQSLSKASGVDRTLIQKMITGDRIPADKEILEKLIEAFMLSPRQAKQLREAYYIARIGEDVYLRHLLVKDMIEGFCNDSGINDISIITKYEHSFMNATDNGVFYGSKDINQLLKAVLEAEASNKGIIRILIQPDYKFMIELLSILGSESCLHIEHIFCLQEQGVETDQNKYNLNCIKNTAPLLTSGCDYVPLIYYEDIPTHLNNASIFPYIVMTQTHVVTLSNDYNTAILYQSASFQTLFTSVFHNLKSHTTPLVGRLKPLLSTYEYYHFRNLKQEANSKVPKYSLYIQPNFMFFVDRAMVDKYIADIPIKKQLLDLYELGSHTYFNKIESGKEYTSYFTPEGIEYFWNHGRFIEISNDLYKPFEKKDCLIILKRLYEKSLEDTFYSFLINKEVFKFPDNLIISATEDKSISILYTHPGKDAMHYIIKEKSLATSLFSYLEFLKYSDAVFSREFTLEFLKNKIDIYTEELSFS